MMRTKAIWTHRQNGSRVQAQNQNRRQGSRCAIAKVVHQVLLVSGTEAKAKPNQVAVIRGTFKNSSWVFLLFYCCLFACLSF